MTGHPRCIARLVVAGEQVTGAIAQVSRKVGRFTCDGASCPFEMPTCLGKLRRVSQGVRNRVKRVRVLVERLESLPQSGVQNLDRGMFVQSRQIAGDVLRTGAPD